MKNLFLRSFSNPVDRRIILSSLVILILSLLPLFSDDLYNFIFQAKDSQQNQTEVAELTNLKNDVRIKSLRSFSWRKLNDSTKAFRGDNLFTGENSSSTIEFANGLKIQIGANSLLSFAGKNESSLPELKQGVFKVLASGKTKILIEGKALELDGSESIIEIDLRDSAKPSAKLLKGMAQYQDQNGKVQKLISSISNDISPMDIQNALNLNKYEHKALAKFDNTNSLFLDSLDTSPKETITSTNSPATIPAKLLSVQLDDQYVYTDQLYDFYEMSEGQLYLREKRRDLIKLPIQVVWDYEGDATRMIAQVSNSPRFERIQDMTSVLASDKKLKLQYFSIGINFIRTSFDLKEWSSVQQVSILAEPLKVQNPELIIRQKFADQDYFKQKLDIEFNKSSQDLKHWLIEVSEDLQFESQNTEVIWTDVPRVQISKSSQKTFYIRSRSLNSNFELTSYSPVYTVKPLAIPNQTDLILGKREQTEADRELASAEKDAELEKENVIKSKPASRLAEKIKLPIESHEFNQAYKKSYLAFSGAAFSIISSEQLSAGQKSPVSLQASLSSLSWFGDKGIEANFRAKASDVVKPENTSISPITWNAMLHYRWNIGFNPFPKQSRSHFGITAGYESYRNSNSGLFSSQYDLIKTGLTFKFPFYSNWDTGGEFLYGIGLDQSKKYEISGFAHYYFEKNWSFGVGYRVHLFEAGSLSSVPIGLPYREGYEETYSTLRWHY